MNKPNKAALLEWAQALESGKYAQTQEQLGTIINGEKFYCCLGVACELFAERAGIKTTWSKGDSLTSGVTWGDLPDAVVKFLGVRDGDPDLIGEDDEVRSAATLNDSCGYTFPQIAAAIRRTFKLEEVDNDRVQF